MFTKPADREVVCHASAWDIDNKDDLRIKMCIKRQRRRLHHHPPRARPQLLPARLQQAAVCSTSTAPTTASTRRSAMPSLCRSRPNIWSRSACSRAAACRAPTRTSACCCARRWTRSPSCRSACSSTAIAGAFSTARSRPADYNTAWTKMRTDYQGIVPPVDAPGRRLRRRAPSIHIPGNTPYTRYFLARILQFQFYKAACDQAGWKGPLHRCSFYGNKEVGAEAERDARNGRVEAVARRARGVHRHAARCRARRWPNISRR